MRSVFFARIEAKIAKYSDNKGQFLAVSFG